MRREVKQIGAWETTDGGVFKSKTTSQSHQQILDFKEWYSNHKLISEIELSTETVIEWLILNKADILDLLEDL